MAVYVLQNDEWIKVDTTPSAPPYIEVDPDAPAVRFVGAGDAPVQLTGAPVDPDADTIHTVMGIDTSLQHGTPLCAVYVKGNDLTVEDRRPPDAPPQFREVPSTLRSALDEILIPVYVDDAIEELSEELDGLVAIHTTQYDDGPNAPCTYFRTSVFEEGTLLLEAERGSL